jgi:hypothetical protein
MRIAETEAVLRALREHPLLDSEHYDAEVMQTERELLRLMLAERRDSS